MKVMCIFILTILSFLNVSGQQTVIDSIGNFFGKSSKGNVAIFYTSGGKDYSFFYGDKSLPDSSTAFDLGNLTETFTSLLFAAMVVEGKMHVDDHLEKYLPDGISEPVYQPLICRPIDLPDRSDNEMSIQFKPFACSPDSTSSPQGILLCDLSTHTAGLPFWPANAGKPEVYDSNYSVIDLLNFIAKYTPNRRHGFEYRPSATGTMILGYCIGKADSISFENALDEKLFNRMNMRSTTFSSENQVARIFHPYYGLKSTLADMSRFLHYNISINQSELNNVLNYSHNARLISNHEEIALGWKIKMIESVRYVYASGKSARGSSFIAFDEITHHGIVVLDSSTSNAAQIGINILKELNKRLN